MPAAFTAVLVARALRSVHIPWGALLGLLMDGLRDGRDPDVVREDVVQMLDELVRWDILLGPGAGDLLEEVDDDLIREGLARLDEHGEQIRSWCEARVESLQARLGPWLRRHGLRRRRVRETPPDLLALLRRERAAQPEAHGPALSPAEAPGAFRVPSDGDADGNGVPDALEAVT